MAQGKCTHVNIDWNTRASYRLGQLWPCGNWAWDGRCSDCGQKMREEYAAPIREDSVSEVEPYPIDKNGEAITA